MHFAALSFAAFLAVVNALTITSPSGVVDPTQPITIEWTSDASDPSTVDLFLDQPGGLTQNEKIATGVSTSSRSYILPANSILTYGSGFNIKAESTTGDTIATSPSFSLSVGASVSNGVQVSFISSNTFTGLPTSAGAGTAQSALATGSVTSSADSNTTLSGSRTGFSTSTTSTGRSTTSTHTSASSTASATTSANAQPRLGTNSQIAFSAAGILAGLAALLA